MEEVSVNNQNPNETSGQSKSKILPRRTEEEEEEEVDLDELMKTIQNSSKSFKLQFLDQDKTDSKRFDDHDGEDSRANTATNPRTLKSTRKDNAQLDLDRNQKLKLQAMIADSLDNLILVYLNLMMNSAEDRLMKPELENMRSYLKRVVKKSKEDERRNQISQPSTRRFILNGIGSSSSSSSSSGHIQTLKSSTDCPSDLNKDHHHHHHSSVIPKKIKLTQAEIEDKINFHRDQPIDQKIILPEIRQVIKNPPKPHFDHNDEEEEEDDDEQDDDLKIYDD